MTASTAVLAKNLQFSGFSGESNLTELQQLYWIGHRLRPSSTHFNNAFSFTLSAPIDPQLFQAAFATAVCQYDALRTVIWERAGVPQPHVLSEPPAELMFIDFSSEAHPAVSAKRWQQQRVQRPFHLEDCLYDSALLKLAEQQFVWFLNQHHLITDASSFFLIAETVLALYQTMLRGEPVAQCEKPTFARYAATLQQQQASSRAAKSQAFWREKLQHKPEPLHFYGRITSQDTSGQVQRWMQKLGTEQTGKLIALAEAADLGAATSELRQFCLTATLFFSLLHQLTGNTRLGFVTTISNRATQVNRQTVGVLMELCPVLVTIAPGDTFFTLLQKVVAEMRQLLLHYRYGASQAASTLALDVMFTFVQRPSLQLAEQNVAHEIIHPGCGSEQLGLHIHYLADSSSYEFYLDFQQDSFTSAEQEHAWQSLQQLVNTLLENPDAPIAQAAIPWPQTPRTELPATASLNGQANGRTRPAYHPPTNPTEALLQQIWEEILEQSPIGIDDDFFALGGESWRAMNLLTRLEAATGHYLPLGILLTHSTIAGLAKQIDTPVQPEAVIQVQPGLPAVPPLFVIPGAAGNTLAIDRLARQMAPDQPVYTFQMPTMAVDHLPSAEVRDLAAYYLEAMQTVQASGPYFLAGYSAGGIFAYEIAQQLRALGEKVGFLGIIDMPAPNFNSKRWQKICRTMARFFRISAASEEKIYLLGHDLLNRAAYFAVRGSRVWLRHYGRLSRTFWYMSWPQKWRRLRRVRRGKAGLHLNEQPVLHDMDASSLTDPRARALFELYDRAVRKYVPEPYSGRLTLLRCPLGYGRREIRSPYPHYGWQPLVRHLETHTINAQGHLALLQAPAVATVGQTIQNVLSESIKIYKEEAV